MPTKDGPFEESGGRGSDCGRVAAIPEIAAILAHAILRLRSRAALSGENAASKNPSNLAANGLEVPGETVLSVTSGVNGSRESQRRQGS
jgi:hypothetical protein